MKIVSLIFIGLSLSIDAFTLSLAYGLLSIPNKKIILTSLLVGFLHFSLPILGSTLATYVSRIINFDTRVILILILILILIDLLKENDTHDLSINASKLIIFSFLVSFDSFSIGIGIKYITNNVILAGSIFSILSSFFTFLGFNLGKFLYKELEKKSKIIGIILISITIFYFLCK